MVIVAVRSRVLKRWISTLGLKEGIRLLVIPHRRSRSCCRAGRMSSSGASGTVRCQTRSPGSDEPFPGTATLEEARYRLRSCGKACSSKRPPRDCSCSSSDATLTPIEPSPKTANACNAGNRETTAPRNKQRYGNASALKKDCRPLHDRPVDHALGHRRFILQTIAQATPSASRNSPGTPDDRRSGHRSDSRVAAAGKIPRWWCCG